MTALHAPGPPWAAAPRTLLLALAVVTALLVATVVTLAVLLSTGGPDADVGPTTPPPPAKTCPGGPPGADC